MILFHLHTVITDYEVWSLLLPGFLTFLVFHVITSVPIVPYLDLYVDFPREQPSPEAPIPSTA